jgi:hypothetical protein
VALDLPLLVAVAGEIDDIGRLVVADLAEVRRRVGRGDLHRAGRFDVAAVDEPLPLEPGEEPNPDARGVRRHGERVFAGAEFRLGYEVVIPDGRADAKHDRASVDDDADAVLYGLVGGYDGELLVADGGIGAIAGEAHVAASDPRRHAAGFVVVVQFARFALKLPFVTAVDTAEREMSASPTQTRIFAFVNSISAVSVVEKTKGRTRGAAGWRRGSPSPGAASSRPSLVPSSSSSCRPRRRRA